MVADAAADVAMNLRRVNVFLFTSVFSLSCGSWLPAGDAWAPHRQTALAERASVGAAACTWPPPLAMNLWTAVAAAATWSRVACSRRAIVETKKGRLPCQG